MKTTMDLSAYLEERVLEISRLKKEGKKIVGYVPGGFMPDELVWAGGAIPVGLNRGGDYDAVLKSVEYIPRFFDTYSRSQIGYWALGEPLFMVDLVVVPCTDRNISTIADCWEMWTGTKVLKLGIPHNNISDHAFKYYLEDLYLLKEEIEKLTGNKITDDGLRKEIDSGNRMRFLLRQISETRKAERPPISGKDYIRLHHASFLLDREIILDKLEKLLRELKKEKGGKKGARILLIGSSISQGDYKIYDLLESAGANVVIEDFSEGMRPYWQEVPNGVDLMEALADCYFRKRTPPPAFLRPTEERAPFLLKLAEEFRVDGIVWYSMLYREAYDIECVYFGRIAKEKGFPFIKIMSEYDNAEHGPLRTRIEAFIESIEDCKS